MKERTIRSITVDDEAPARSLLRELLSHHPEIEIVAECANGFEAVRTITELKPDLVFLDIQMPKLDGFEVLDLIDHPCEVVFTTAYDQYALKAFEVHAVDYLLKPFRRERFEEALERAKERLGRNQQTPSRELLASIRTPEQRLERVLVREHANVIIIPTDRIDYIQAQDDYIGIRSDGKTHLKQQRLSEMEQALDQTRFVRVHRSYIVNIDRLAKIELYAKDSRVAILKDGTKLPVSRSGYDKLKNLL